MELQQTERVVEVTDDLVVLQIVTAESLKVGDSFTGITDFWELASFNKVADDEIAVPGMSSFPRAMLISSVADIASGTGCPPRFSPPMKPLDLPEDSKNEALNMVFPKFTHPFEPLLRSVEIMQPTLNIFNLADVVSNAGNLRKLFELLSNTTWMLDRYDVEVRGNTLLLSRWNGDPDLKRSYGRGCGFERETCRYCPGDDPAVQRSASHHRVVTYDLGGLQCVVQAEVDSYSCACHHAEEPSTPIKTNPARKKDYSDIQHPLPSPPADFTLPAAFSALTFGDPGSSPTFTPAMLPFALPPSPPPAYITPSPTLRIHHVGRHIPIDCLVEIKTQNGHGPPRFTQEPQLYFARRTKLYLAKHKKGVFAGGRDIKVTDKKAELEDWEAREQATLQKLAALLVSVREGVRVLGPSVMGGMSLVCESDGSGRDKGVSVKFCARVDGEGGWLLPV
jgi:hypothetical protein